MKDREHASIYKKQCGGFKETKLSYYLIKSQIQIPKNPLYNRTESGKHRHF